MASGELSTNPRPKCLMKATAYNYLISVLQHPRWSLLQMPLNCEEYLQTIRYLGEERPIIADFVSIAVTLAKRKNLGLPQA